ncbi:MAG: threonine ammonia-lyase, biosynthetic [Gammaproteobacteria bacterium]|nr:threonine ammonia-lyase, biosynthetic [Gammaproteobacteria bacterium]
MSRDYVERILRARVYDVAKETPLDRVALLSDKLGNDVFLKREDLQSVFSFKLRGAYNKMANLPAVERERGVAAASAGNHAQGVALAAQRLGVPAAIVMPTTTPRIKVEAVRRLGAEVILHGVSFDDSRTHALALTEERGLTFVHPFDDPDVIAGQGTVAMEILRQVDTTPYAVFVAIGGGGLIAGMGAYIKALWPEVKVIGVEPEDSPTMYRALEAGHPVDLDEVGLFADGVAVRRVGDHCFDIAKTCVDEVVLVNTDETCAAIRDIYDDTRSIAEPAGALGIAGLKRYVAREGLSGACLVAVDCGANVNFDRLRHIAERAEIGEQREGVFAVTIPERPGSFRAFCECLGGRAVTEFNYRFADAENAHIFVGLELRAPGDREEIIAQLEQRGYRVTDMSDNEMAKLHVRYMVGGRCGKTTNERLYRFEFPERPGALLTFLKSMGGQWNISLFHYRNHGSAYGRVLAGIEVRDDELDSLEASLATLGYRYQRESDNPAYELFLS